MIKNKILYNRKYFKAKVDIMLFLDQKNFFTQTRGGLRGSILLVVSSIMLFVVRIFTPILILLAIITFLFIFYFLMKQSLYNLCFKIVGEDLNKNITTETSTEEIKLMKEGHIGIKVFSWESIKFYSVDKNFIWLFTALEGIKPQIAYDKRDFKEGDLDQLMQLILEKQVMKFEVKRKRPFNLTPVMI